jgi:hypothetical protein
VLGFFLAVEIRKHGEWVHRGKGFCLETNDVAFNTYDNQNPVPFGSEQ